jgi:hypoxanthine phosphoribosyltransferase
LRLVELAGPQELAAVVDGLAIRIGEDYRDKNPVFIGVLKGAFMFTADLVRRLDIPLEVDFIRASSYGAGKVSQGRVSITKGPEIELCGRNVIIVEDIVDTGRTLDAIVGHIKALGPASIAVCTLLDKPSRREVGCSMGYVGMEVEDAFLVGYGLDCAEKYRNLCGLYVVEDTEP